jgi:hypothetical protein
LIFKETIPCLCQPTTIYHCNTTCQKLNIYHNYTKVFYKSNINIPIGIVWNAIWQFKNNQNTILSVPFFHILHTVRVALDTFRLIPPHQPRPLGLLGVGLKHKSFVFCPHYRGTLIYGPCRYPWVPAVLGGSWLLWRTSGSVLFFFFYNGSSSVKNWKPRSGLVLE